MRIELLGTGGYFANARRHTACVLLPELGVIFDAGSGLFRLTGRCHTPQLHLFLSHSHLDHISGLPFLLMPVLRKEFDSVSVHARPRTLEAITQHLFAEAVFPVPVPFDCIPIEETGCFELSHGVTIHWQPLTSHPGGSMAYQVDCHANASGQRLKISYITDTCTDGSYTEFIRGSNVLIHECYFANDRRDLAQRTGHSCAGDVARLAAEAEVKQLVVVHVDPTSDLDDPIDVPSMRSIFANTVLGTDGMVIEV